MLVDRQLAFKTALTGVFLALAAALFGSIANICVKITSLPRLKRNKRHLSLLWALIIFLYACNCTLDFISFGYAPLSLLAPIGSLTIAINAILAYFILEEKLTTMDKIGSFLIMAGAAGCVAVGSRQAPDRTAKDLEHFLVRPAFIIFCIVNLCALFVIVAMERHLRPATLDLVRSRDDLGSRVDCLMPDVPPKDVDRHRLHAVVYGLMTAMIAAWTNLEAKAMVELLSHEKNWWHIPHFYILLVLLIICGITYLSCLTDMLGKFEAVVIVPIFHCFFIIMLVTYSNFYFVELRSLVFFRIFTFFACLSVALCGLWILAQRAPHYTPPPRRFTITPRAASKEKGKHFDYNTNKNNQSDSDSSSSSSDDDDDEEQPLMKS